MLIDLAFLIPTLILFPSFIKYGKKNVLLKDFVLVGICLMIEPDDDLRKEFSGEEKSR